ncbi:hypothetical protein BH10PAT2_BH10PAT2_2270 [soil metagenome]
MGTSRKFKSPQSNMKIPSLLTTSIRNGVYSAAALFDMITLRKSKGVYILCYHSVNEDSWKFSIDLKVMEKQILWLSKHFTIVSLSEIEKFRNGSLQLKKPAIALTFDDGYKDILKLKEFFQKLDIHPTVFLIGDTAHANEVELETKRDFLNTSEILMLKKAGWEIGSHSMTHADFSSLSPVAMESEITSSKKALESQTGLPIHWIAYPKGAYNDQVKETVAKSGYRLGFSLDDEDLTSSSDLFAMPRIGVDRSHSFPMFKILTSPTCILVRKTLKSSGIGKLM